MYETTIAASLTLCAILVPHAASAERRAPAHAQRLVVRELRGAQDFSKLYAFGRQATFFDEGQGSHAVPYWANQVQLRTQYQALRHNSGLYIALKGADVVGAMLVKKTNIGRCGKEQGAEHLLPSSVLADLGIGQLVGDKKLAVSEVDHIEVRQDRRGSGVGSAMMQFAFDKLGLPVYVGAAETKRAAGFYESLSPTGRVGDISFIFLNRPQPSP